MGCYFMAKKSLARKAWDRTIALIRERDEELLKTRSKKERKEIDARFDKLLKAQWRIYDSHLPENKTKFHRTVQRHRRILAFHTARA